MFKYFLHKKFWLPIMLLVILATLLEAWLRFGVWDNMVKPQSFLGNVIYRKKAIEEFGLDKIDWITVGDSRTDWGLEHGKILDIQRQNGLNHLRMSFESSNFMAIQATIYWSIAHMPNLKGIMFGFSENTVVHYSDVTKQYRISWPFRQYYDYKEYTYFPDFYNNLSFVFRNAWPVYFDDIKDFLKNILLRKHFIDKYMKKSHASIFKYNFNKKDNSCSYKVDTLKQCVSAAEKIKLKKGRLSGLEHFIVYVCNTQNAKNRLKKNIPNYKMSNSTYNIIYNNWKQLFNYVLSKNINLKIITYPEHQMLSYIIKPSNATDFVNQLIEEFSLKKNFDYLDLRQLLDKKPYLNKCNYFADALHFNNKGKSIITNEIVKSLTIPKSNLIRKSSFEN